MTRLVTVALLTIAVPLAAQSGIGGSATFELTMVNPTPQTRQMMGDTLHMWETVRSDGRRFAIDITGSGLLALTHIRLAGALGRDTLEFGILPGSLGGGMRIVMPMNAIAREMASVPALLGPVMNRYADSTPPVYHDIGTTQDVVGMTCENWEVVAYGDTLETCVVPMPKSMLAFKTWADSLPFMRSMLSAFPGLAASAARSYGGQPMMPIRTVGRRNNLHLFLTSHSSSIPDSADLEMPPGMTTIGSPR